MGRVVALKWAIGAIVANFIRDNIFGIPKNSFSDMELRLLIPMCGNY